MPKLKCFPSRLAVVFAQSIEARCKVENEDVVGAAPTGDASNYIWVINNFIAWVVPYYAYIKGFEGTFLYFLRKIEHDVLDP